MARQNAPLLAFNRGEVSKDVLPRVDVERMRLAAECQLNWLPSVLGSMALRPGLEFVGEITGVTEAILLPFVFSKFDTAQIELSANKMRVRIDDTLINRVSVVTLILDSGFIGGGSWTTSNSTAGATATIGGGLLKLKADPVGSLAQVQQIITVAGGDQAKEHALRVVVANGPVTLRLGTAAGLSDLIQQTALDTGTHSLAFTPGVATIYLQIETADAWEKSISQVIFESAGTLELPTPWGSDDLETIRYDNSGDVIFLAAYGMQQYKIERRGTRSWSVVKYRSDNGPFGNGIVGSVQLTPSVYRGNGTLSSDRPYFNAGMVGRLFLLFTPGQANRTNLGAANAFSDPVRVNGVGSTMRNYSWTASGAWTGTLRLQRSFDGPDSGYTDVASITANGTLSSVTGSAVDGSGHVDPTNNPSPLLDNVICWERVGFKAGEYGGGVATVISGFTGGGGWGICRVTGYTSSTQVSIEVLEPFSSLQATETWSASDWSDLTGWPTSLAFHDGRLQFFGGDGFWGSQADNYTGFAQQDSEGEPLGDAGAIIERFGSGAVDSVNWGLSLMRLLAGRDQQVSSIRASSLEEVITPTNVSSRDCSTQGTARAAPIKIDKEGVFIEQTGRRVYLLVFDPTKGDYTQHDITRLNLDIGKVGFKRCAAARQPDTIMSFIRNDGQLANFLYDPEDEVSCWFRYQTLGWFEDYRPMPTATGIETAQYFIVRRKINGVMRRFIEKLAPRDNCVGGDLNQIADSHVVYQGAPATTISLPHLPNTEVIIWADGADRGTAVTDGAGLCTMPGGAAYSTIVAGLGGKVVTMDNGDTPVTYMDTPAAYDGMTAEVFSDRRRIGTITAAAGRLTLPNGRKEARLVAFFGYCAPYYSAKLAYGAQLGTALSQKKKIDHLGLILFNTHYQGLKMGQSFANLDSMPQMLQEQPIAEHTVFDEYDDTPIAVPGSWDTDARLALLAQAPRPVKVGAVVVSMNTNEK